MSYRIKLHVIKEKELLKNIKEFEEDDDKYKYFELENTIIDTELMDIIDLEYFEDIFEDDVNEYAPKKLQKKDLLTILETYRKEILKYLVEKDERNTKLLGELRHNANALNDKEFRHKLIRELDKRVYMDYATQLHFRKNLGISDSSVYMLQYFFLSKIYNELKEDETLVITHG